MGRYDGHDDNQVGGKITGRERPAPFTEISIPVSNRQLLLLDPELKVLQHEPDVIKCDDEESFINAVKAVEGGNKLVEFRSDGSFRHANERLENETAIVTYKLEQHETAGMLCLSGSNQFRQRELLQYQAQHPDVLGPVEEDHNVVWEKIAAYKSTGVTSIHVEHTDDRVVLNVERKDGAEGQQIPRLWRAVSPVYDGYCAQDVTLRLDIVEPQPDKTTGQVNGALTFCFSLWQPAASEVMAEAAAQVIDRMRKALEGFVVLRGSMG